MSLKNEKLDQGATENTVNVNAYLNGYLGGIYLRLNLHFQLIKKLLQNKKVTYM